MFFLKKIWHYYKIFFTIIILWFAFAGFNKISFFSFLIITCLTFIVCYKMKIFGIKNQIFRLMFLKYIIILGKNIVISTIKIIKLVYQDNIEIQSAIKEIDMTGLNKQERVLFSNLITMTPGTFVINAQGDRFLIHALDENDLNNMEKDKIRTILHNTRF